jgi:hypothetical protein
MKLENIKEWFDRKWFMIKRFFKHTYQYWSRGFSDKETWELYDEIAKFVHPRLVIFRKLNNGIPYGETEKSWDKKLDKMIISFDMLSRYDEIEESWCTLENSKYKSNVKKVKSDQKKIQEGLDLFAKFYHGLWW